MEKSTVLLSSDEVAKMLNCSKRRVSEMRMNGLLPGVRFGKPWQYYEADVEAFILKNKGRDVTEARNMPKEAAIEYYGIVSLDKSTK